MEMGTKGAVLISMLLLAACGGGAGKADDPGDGRTTAAARA
jgi:hypothetical protein